MSKILKICSILAMLVMSAIPARAAPSVFAIGDIAYAIRDFDVDGTLYIVSWGYQESEPLFQGNLSGAQAAATAIADLLNGAGVHFVFLNPTGPINYFNVQYDGTTSVVMSSYSTDPWELVPGPQTAFDSVTIFSPQRAVAEPTSLALLGAGLLGMATLVRRRRV